MDSNASAAGYFVASSEYNYIGRDVVEDSNIIDLGLSLRALQPAADDQEAYYPASTHGKLSMCGLRLFQDDSQFSLFYKDDKNELWRTVGDVPWREFVNHVTRLRIVRKDIEAHHISSSLSLHNSL
ncbi:hypothetical protein RD792_015445 [Penstemon davidsonii]|uniref:Auxin-responsive protein n=1 Tax=Penstemon davidsonii TaxID=160366 RepID=A0ABR0CTR4_9LAMI|nr:hypothetical protein RD792_015445 [Penstemon davidsonii]